MVAAKTIQRALGRYQFMILWYFSTLTAPTLQPKMVNSQAEIAIQTSTRVRHIALQGDQHLSDAPTGPILATPELQNLLKHMIDQLNHLSHGPKALRTGTTPGSNPPNIPTMMVSEIVIEHDVFINNKTTLETLYQYPPNTYLEYPETREKPVGHLFELDPQTWEHPNLHFAYSQGKPAGQSLKTDKILCPVLVNKTGGLVACAKRFSTCQGSKACPFNDIDILCEGHTRASCSNIEQRLQEEQPTVRSETEQQTIKHIWSASGEVMSRCEHYSKMNKDHWADFSIGDGSYDLDYLEAIFSNNLDTIHEIEDRARLSDYGPLAPCLVVSNFSSQKLIAI
ncbi:hypothetical protein C8R44DRAFT_727094 [Mycena epipterygia]|nr:hypothetical protein C8R44DRAFT_727094 [Mycena epipterygia]